eukprot:jgi/Botrbrau1/16212/Bobra.0066s0001.1
MPPSSIRSSGHGSTYSFPCKSCKHQMKTKLGALKQGLVPRRHAPVQRMFTHAVKPAENTMAGAMTGPKASAIENVENGVIVVGAGVAGLAVARALCMLGIPAVVLERAEDLLLTGTGLAMWANAFKALEALGVADKIRDVNTMQTMIVRNNKGKSLVEMSMEGGGVRAVQRSRLITALADSLPANMIRFNSRLLSVSQDADGVEVELQGGKRMRARALVGADGVSSVVDSYLGLPPPSYRGYVGYRGLAHFKGGYTGDLLGTREMVQLWGNGVRVGTVGVDPKNEYIYWFVTNNMTESELAKGPKTGQQFKEEALQAVHDFAGGIKEFINATDPDTVLRNRLGDRWMKPGTPVGEGCISLAGDAFHPMTPNMGQGACTAIEDAVVLGQHLKRAMEGEAAAKGEGLARLSNDQLGAALRAYEAERMERVYPIQKRSHMAGALLQIPFGPVVALRNMLVPKWMKRGAVYLSATTFDVGTLA